MANLQVHMFPCRTDNYGFLIHDPESGDTACIDTPDADRILAEASAKGWRITQIWNTHWHPDHAGGNEKVKAETGCTILAPVAETGKISVWDRTVSEGDIARIGTHEVNIIDTPGHTLGHICYYISYGSIAFVGDTLFALGCGRLFEGDPQQMWSSLKKLRALPDDTTVYCAHEYTAGNAAFALSVDPDNRDLIAYADRVQKQRSNDEPTVPTTLAAERAANPFLRADNLAFQTAMGHPGDAVATFTEVRKRKDNF